MKLRAAALAAITAASLCVFGGARAGAAFSDQLCPEATQYVIALGELKSKDAQIVYDAAHAAASAYESCAKRQLADGNVEPGVHYAYTRESGFAVVEARALFAMNRPADARAVAQNAKRLAQDVFDWQRSSDFSGNSKDTRASIYHDAAHDVITAADAVIAKTNAPPAMPFGSPAPMRSPTP